MKKEVRFVKILNNRALTGIDLARIANLPVEVVYNALEGIGSTAIFFHSNTVKALQLTTTELKYLLFSRNGWR